MARVKQKTKSRAANRGSNSATFSTAVWWLYCAFIALIPLSAFNGGVFNMTIYLQSGCLLFFSYYCWRLRQTRNVSFAFPQSIVFFALLTLLLWAALSLLWSDNRYLNWLILSCWLTGLIGLMLTFWHCQQAAQPNAANILTQPHWLLVHCIFLASIVVVILGIGQYLWHWDIIRQPAPPAATFKNKNIFAQYLVMTLPLGMALLLHNQQPKWQWCYGVIAALSLSMIIYTTTRAAWIAIALEFILLIAWYLYRHLKGLEKVQLGSNRLRVLLCSGLLFIGMIHFNDNGFNANAISQYWNETETIIQDASLTERKGNIRLINWLNSWAIFQDHWLVGVGLGNWQVIYPLYKRVYAEDWMANQQVVWNYAHNDYIETAVSLGVVGLALLLTFISSLIFLAWRLANAKVSQHSTLGLALCMAIGGIATTAIFSFPLQLSVATFLLLTYVGILLVLQQLTNPQPISLIKLDISRQWQTAMMAVLVICTLVIGAFNYSRYQSNQFVKQAGKFLRRNDYNNMLPLASQAAVWNPWNIRALELKGIAQSQLQRHTDATKTYARFLNLYPHNVTAMENASISYLHIGEYHQAMAIVEVLLQVQPDSVIGNINKAVLLYHSTKDRKAEAIAYYKKALQLNPNHEMAGEMKRIIGVYEQSLKK